MVTFLIIIAVVWVLFYIPWQITALAACIWAIAEWGLLKALFVGLVLLFVVAAIWAAGENNE